MPGGLARACRNFRRVYGGTRFRAALRWELFGAVAVAPGIGHSDVTIGAIRRYRLDSGDVERIRGSERREIRVAAPATQPSNGERLVERVVAPGSKTIAVVLAKRAG
jgi:hypothetical protein